MKSPLCSVQSHQIAIRSPIAFFRADPRVPTGDVGRCQRFRSGTQRLCDVSLGEGLERENFQAGNDGSYIMYTTYM